MDYAHLSQHGYTQVLNIPKKYRLPSKQVTITKHGDGLLITPVKEGYADLVNALDAFSDDFMKNGRNQPPAQERNHHFS
jgi:antitoxin VapB